MVLSRLMMPPRKPPGPPRSEAKRDDVIDI
jgi:hypothetical protein